MESLPEPFASLASEHRYMLRVLGQACDAFAVAGTQPGASGPVSAALAWAPALSTLLAENLTVHAEEEEAVVFAAIRALGDPGSVSIVGEMLVQHQEILARQRALECSLFAAATIDVGPGIDHGAPEANGSTTGARLTAASAVLKGCLETGNRLLHGLQVHFDEEEASLFALAAQRLAPETRARLARSMCVRRRMAAHRS